MDDSCAVCAESLEWVAYGSCGHKDVCSTCVARLRFICDDRRCCICKSQSDVVFVTKALGDFTKTINDFSILPPDGKEGKMGQYWYHEDTQAFFDDSDHYKMIKAMCRLSCSQCDKTDLLLDQPEIVPKRRTNIKFKNIDHLKGHLFHKHKLLMCSLCLEGRKIFICEQKLYTRSQLNQHINSGDSEVDGTESERGGFMGHPQCEFCLTPFYGDNELYTHMSTEHFTCHLCQRQHPGQYEYYKNYDDLEMHFRRDHFLCEDEGCLAKKFTVFMSEAELKRHNTMEHGGRMSRSKRSAALQIPTSFRYRRNSEQDNRRGRGRMFRQDPAEDELSFAIQASLEASSGGSSSTRRTMDRGEIDADTLIPDLESLANTDSETSSRYRQAVSQSSISGTLGESAFPPLQVTPGSNQQNSHDAAPKNTMAAHLRRKNNGKINVLNRAPAWSPATSRNSDWPAVNGVSRPASTSTQARPAAEVAPVSSSSYSVSSQTRPPSSFASSVVSSRTSGSTSRMSHSLSAPNLSERQSLDTLNAAAFPPVSLAAQARRPSVADQGAVVKKEDVQTANKSLVEKMRIGLGFDEDKFTAFKIISGEYRQGSMNAEAYLAHVEQFGLSHLVVEMARLLPNAQKQKELIDAYNINMAYNAQMENGWSNGISIKEGGTSSSKKGKGKSVDSSNNVTAKNNLADNIISTVRELQSSYHRPSEGEVVEVLSKDGYRASKGKSKVVVDDSELSRGGESGKQKSQMESLSAGGGANQSLGNGDGKNKQRKKTSKFLRVRLGDGSIDSLLDSKNSDPDPDPPSDLRGSASNEGLPARGVWGNGGGKKLFAKKTLSKGSRN